MPLSSDASVSDPWHDSKEAAWEIMSSARAKPSFGQSAAASWAASRDPGFEAASFAFAFVRTRYILDGDDYPEVRLAGTAVAIALFIGIGVSVVRPGSAGPSGGASQGSALLGTLAGIFTIAIGVGPRTIRHVAYHVIIAAVFVQGIIGAADGEHIAPEVMTPISICQLTCAICGS